MIVHGDTTPTMAERSILVISSDGSLVAYGDATDTGGQMSFLGYTFTRLYPNKAYYECTYAADRVEDAFAEVGAEYLLFAGDFDECLEDGTLIDLFDRGTLSADVEQDVLRDGYIDYVTDLKTHHDNVTAAEDLLAEDPDHVDAASDLATAREEYNQFKVIADAYAAILALLPTDEEED